MDADNVVYGKFPSLDQGFLNILHQHFFNPAWPKKGVTWCRWGIDFFWLQS